MWKLIITQKRAGEYTGVPIEEKVEFVGKDIATFGSIVSVLSSCEEAGETTYRIEKVEEDGEA